MENFDPNSLKHCWEEPVDLKDDRVDREILAELGLLGWEKSTLQNQSAMPNGATHNPLSLLQSNFT